MDNTIFIYKINGFYFGFIRNSLLYSRDGIYIGWAEGNFIWDANGRFRGVVTEINNYKYILINRLSIPPVPRMPKVFPLIGTPPTPPSNIVPISLSPELADGF